MVISVDIGNTDICLGIFTNNDKLPQNTYRVKTDDYADFFTLFENDLNKFKHHLLNYDQNINMCISCVVPFILNDWVQCVKKFFNSINKEVNFIFCTSNTVRSLSNKFYDCAYAIPEEVGSDIICACIAAKVLYGNSCVIIDLGTATNINIIDKCGKFVGAMIYPGILTSLKALINDASALKKIDICVPKKLIGSTTEESIQSGLVYGDVERIDGLINRIDKELDLSAKVICTGGYSNLISPLLNHVNLCCPNLLLQGLKIFADNYNE